MTKQLKADLALLGVTFIWGSTYVLTKNSLNHLETFNFLAIRFLISALLSGIIFYKNILNIKKDTLKYGVLIGIVLFMGYTLQTLGLHYTTPSKSGFITGFSVVLVPILSAYFLKEQPQKAAAVGAILALIGLAFLTLDSNLTLNKGDFFTFLGSFMFALHIITVGKYTVEVDSIGLGIVQIAVVGLLSLVLTFGIENPTIPTSMDVWLPIAFLTVLCTSAAFTIQNIAQRYTSPTHTALIYTGEPVFSAIFSYFVEGEILTRAGLFGSFLILLGMVMAELNLDTMLAKKEKLQSDELP